MGIQALAIARHVVGPGHPTFVIAEAGVNHNGDVDLARRLVDAAAEAGADAVKFQTFKAERVVSPEAPKARYQAETTGAGESQLDMVRKLELDEAAHQLLANHARDRGITFLSTPFDEPSADLLALLGVPAFKVGSGELTNWPFLRYLASKGLPMILSTGMATLADVDEALRQVAEAGAPPVAVLHCVSAYPAPHGDSNLRAMLTLAAAFGLPVGYSDHTLGLEVPLAAVALGATIIEKHFTLDRGLEGPDHRVSLDPEGLAALVRGVRRVEEALGTGLKQPAPSELDTARVARRSIVAALDIAEGQQITASQLAMRRPGTGLPVRFLDCVVGRRASRPLPAGTVITMEMLK